METMTGWPALVMLALVVAAYCMRRFATQSHWFHSPMGAFVLSVGTAVLSAAASAIQKGGLHASAVVPAVVGAVLSLLAMSNPTMSAPESTDTVSGTDRRTGTGGFVTLETLLIVSLLSLGLTGIACAMSGCTPGTDGLRQACSNADEVISSGYHTVVGWYHSDQERWRTTLNANPSDPMPREVIHAHETIAVKALHALDGAMDSKRALCDLIPAIEMGEKHDIPALLGSVIKVVDDLRKVLSDLAPFLSSERERWRAAPVRQATRLSPIVTVWVI